MTIYGIHAYIILTNWSKCRIALGYNYLMMNIIQQVTDPMPMNFLILFLLSYYCYCYYYYCYYYQNYHTTLLLITCCR